jgi:hypothetical protein
LKNYQLLLYVHWKSDKIICKSQESILNRW